MGVVAGRQGFEPWVEFLAPQPLSRRLRSSTPAPPRKGLVKAEGEGFEPSETGTASVVFKTTAFVHSAIPPDGLLVVFSLLTEDSIA